MTHEIHKDLFPLYIVGQTLTMVDNTQFTVCDCELAHASGDTVVAYKVSIKIQNYIKDVCFKLPILNNNLVSLKFDNRMYERMNSTKAMFKYLEDKELVFGLDSYNNLRKTKYFVNPSYICFVGDFLFWFEDFKLDHMFLKHFYDDIGLTDIQGFFSEGKYYYTDLTTIPFIDSYYLGDFNETNNVLSDLETFLSMKPKNMFNCLNDFLQYSLKKKKKKNNNNKNK
jgi:hypothetical protein